MTAFHNVIGIDPGPVPGFVVLDLACANEPPSVVQCSADLATDVLTALLIRVDAPTLVAIEEFVVSRRASRSSTAVAGGQTRRLVELFEQTARDTDPLGSVVRRPAAAVKPWATDERLAAAGLLAATKGMRHARDAARHALFAACRDGDLPDPLSKTYPKENRT